MKERVKCPRCEEFGRLEKVSENTYRINHDFMKNGKKTMNRCHLGNILEIINKFRIISKISPYLIDDGLAEQILNELNNKDKTKLNELLVVIFRLNWKLGFGWKNEKHDLVKQDNCPHCKQKIAVRYRRIGMNPDKTNGKYNVEDINIEQGQADRTLRFKNKFTGRLNSKFELGVEKGNLKEKDIFYEDV